MVNFDIFLKQGYEHMNIMLDRITCVFLIVLLIIILKVSII